jgi:hypothetical protein
MALMIQPSAKQSRPAQQEQHHHQQQQQQKKNNKTKIFFRPPHHRASPLLPWTPLQQQLHLMQPQNTRVTDALAYNLESPGRLTPKRGIM